MMPVTPSAYEAAVTARAALESEIAQAEKDHATRLSRLRTELRAAQQIITAADSGLVDAEAVATSQKVLRVEWWPTVWSGEKRVRITTPEVHRQFEAAVRDLQEGCPRLQRRYFGVKAYDGWSSQIEDHDYGFGPAHGSIWFRIGLTRPKDPLRESDRQACVRWLRAIQANPDLLPLPAGATR